MSAEESKPVWEYSRYRYSADHEHCWHTGSGMDSAIYSQCACTSTMNYICCHCGETKTVYREWSARKLSDDKHGLYNWTNRPRI